MPLVFQQMVGGVLVTKNLYRAADLSNTAIANTTFTSTDGIKKQKDHLLVGGIHVANVACVFLTAADAAVPVAQGLLTLVDMTTLAGYATGGSTVTVTLNNAHDS